MGEGPARVARVAQIDGRDARRIRRPNETSAGRLARDLLYGGLVLAALPFTLVEAACRAGSTIMIEARKKS